MNKKILIIEDEPSLQQVLKISLAEEGFNVLAAGDGREGLKLALNEKPDLILLDLILPVMDGFAVLNELHKTGTIKNTKVIILTNIGYHGNVGEIVKKGVSDYLVKADWEIGELVEKVKNSLKSQD